MQQVRALFASSPLGRIQAQKIASQYQDAGWQVVLGEREGLEENHRWAEENNMTHLLYFHDDEKITMVSFADEMGGFCVEISVSDLVLPKRKK